MDITSAQRLRDFCDDFEIPKILLMKNEEFISGTVADGIATVVTARHVVADRKTIHKVTSRKLVIRKFLSLGFTWREVVSDRLIFDDPEFTPFEIPNYAGKSITEYMESVRWADDCYRPGTKMSPMDNADRALSSVGTPWESPMADYYLGV